MRTLLVLARVSNLPTVWSNCLAAWLLAGGSSWDSFALLCVGATLLYTGGMFLNDAIDQGFDRRYRPERPIVAGQITAQAVWLLSALWLGAGWLIFCLLGSDALLFASILLVTIIAYDVIHKHTALAPVLMAACRFLLYLVAAAVVNGRSMQPVLAPAIALAAYIIGLSYLARGESTGKAALRWTLVLLFAPAIVACLAGKNVPWTLWVLVAVQLSWTLWCLWPRKMSVLRWLPKGVAGLLAGVALVDLVAAGAHGYPLVFIGLFLVAVLLQRIAPAT